jgi:hypothetical protein
MVVRGKHIQIGETRGRKTIVRYGIVKRNREIEKRTSGSITKGCDGPVTNGMHCPMGMGMPMLCATLGDCPGTQKEKKRH